MVGNMVADDHELAEQVDEEPLYYAVLTWHV